MSNLELKMLRLYQGINKATMAELLQIDRMKYEAYESGELELPYEEFCRISRYFDLPSRCFAPWDRNTLHDDTVGSFVLRNGEAKTTSPFLPQEEEDPPEAPVEVFDEETDRLMRVRKAVFLGFEKELDAFLDTILKDYETKEEENI